MIYVGLDVSKTSTALCIEKNGIVDFYSYSTLKANNIWIKNTDGYITVRNILYNYMNEKDYSKSELLKLKEFDEITTLIINDIFSYIENDNEIIIGIEGYSYSSNIGPMIDIVEFTTLLKYKLLNIIKSSNIHIFSPITVKIETCKIVYQPRIEFSGKKVIKEIIHNENKNGKNATKFDKWDMYYSLLDSDVNIKLKDFCLEKKDIITKNKDVPKPIDDCIDSFWIKEIIKTQF